MSRKNKKKNKKNNNFNSSQNEYSNSGGNNMNGYNGFNNSYGNQNDSYNSYNENNDDTLASVLSDEDSQKESVLDESSSEEDSLDSSNSHESLSNDNSDEDNNSVDEDGTDESSSDDEVSISGFSISDVEDEFLRVPKNAPGAKDIKFNEIDIYKIFNIYVLLEKMPEDYINGFSVIAPGFPLQGKNLRRAINLSALEPKDVADVEVQLEFIKKIADTLSEKSDDPMSELLSLMGEIAGMSEEDKSEFIKIIKKVDQSSGKKSAYATKLSKSSSDYDIITKIKSLMEETEFSKKIDRINNLAAMYTSSLKQ